MDLPIKRTNKVVSYFGLLAAVGQLPELVTRMGIAMPLVWNDITPWLKLLGLIGTMVALWAAGGADQHPTADQVLAATQLKEAEAVVNKADAPNKLPTQIALVPAEPVPVTPVVGASPDPDPALASREAAAAELARLRAALAAKTPQE